jgi:hypothetical protein
MKSNISKIFKSDLFYVGALFSLSNIVHFSALLGVEFYFSSVVRSFYFDWYSVIIGFLTGLCLNSLVAAMLVFYQLAGLNKSASKWSSSGRILCLLLPLAPLLDWLLHLLNLKIYTGYRNYFSAEISIFQRIMEVIVPGKFSDVVDIPLGYRIIFVLLSAINAGYIFRFTGSYLRSVLVLIASYASICVIIGALSPSDLQPLTVLKNLVALPVAAWAANIFLIRRIQVSPS